MGRSEITTYQIMDNTVTTDDIKDHTIQLEDLSFNINGGALSFSIVSIGEGKDVTIYSNKQMILADSDITIEGTLGIEGSLIII